VPATLVDFVVSLRMTLCRRAFLGLVLVALVCGQHVAATAGTLSQVEAVDGPGRNPMQAGPKASGDATELHPLKPAGRSLTGAQGATIIPLIIKGLIFIGKCWCCSVPRCSCTCSHKGAFRAYVFCICSCLYPWMMVCTAHVVVVRQQHACSGMCPSWKAPHGCNARQLWVSFLREDRSHPHRSGPCAMHLAASCIC
jgi:hypothetical protein